MVAVSACAWGYTAQCVPSYLHRTPPHGWYLETEIKRPTRPTTPYHQPALTHHLLQLTRCATYVKAMVKDTTAHVQKSIYWASVSKSYLLDKMYVYHTTPWQARVISSDGAISVSAVLYRTWCAGQVARAVYICIYMVCPSFCKLY